MDVLSGGEKQRMAVSCLRLSGFVCSATKALAKRVTKPCIVGWPNGTAKSNHGRAVT